MYHMNRLGSDRGDSAGSGGAKRPFGKVKGDENQGVPHGDKRQKLPALASVVVEAVKMDSLQKLCSSLEPILRKVVGEEVERALARLVPNRLGSRTPPRQIQESPISDLRLDFTNKLSLPLFTGGKVEGEGGLPVLIVLKDETTGQVVNSGPLSSAKLEVVVLDGDFANEDDEWTAEDFEKYVVKERDGKRPLLTGDLNVTLKEGVGTLGELTFTDNSSWIRSRKFRLGVRVAPGLCEARIKECKTEAFTVKDHRGELYKKHYPPRLHDEVWRLDKIGKDGAFHKRLQQSSIKTVEDFLRCYMMDQQKLRNTLGSGMSNKMWDATIEHAKTCVLSGKLYVYYADSSQSVGVIFNNIYELLGVTSNNTYKSVESLNESEKVYVDKLVKVAYENWASVSEYENGTLVNETASKHPMGLMDSESSTVTQEQAGMYSQPMGLPQQQGQFQSMPTPTSIPANSMAPQLYGYGPDHTSRYANQSNQTIQNNHVFNSGADPHGQSSPTISLQGSFTTNGGPANTGLALGPSQALLPRAFGDYSNPMSQQVFQGASVDWQRYPANNPMTPVVYDFEDDIRAQALSLLSNEDMQQLLRSQYLTRSENVQLQGEDTYFSNFTPAPAINYIDEGVRTSGKAYIGWLKLKAALRWGIFIRKIAAKKAIQRAQLEEIED
ncbi:hypothetical protein L7F22_025459 [Adiantum nelumboides]|nr:hypothetical protein [Adiantum nelumboides]